MTEDWIPYSTQSIDDADVTAVVKSIKSGWLTTGPAVDAFEKALEAKVGAPVAAVSSGTAALHAAYAAAGLGPGFELITTPMTFIATAAAAVHLGAKVRFVDVLDEDLNIDPAAVDAAMSDQTRAICAVDFAGHPADLDRLNTIGKSRGVIVVEDASHSLGAFYRGRPVGSLADLTTFSFHPVKAITTGEGGAVSTAHSELLEAVRRFRTHGLVRNPEEHAISGQGRWHQEVHKIGLNYRLPDPLAALGTSQLKKLDSFLLKRSELASRYTEVLKTVTGIRVPHLARHVRHAWHLYTIRIAGGKRREVFEHMRSQKIGVQVHYLPIHLHPVFAHMGYRKGMCPVAESAYEELLSLPLFPDMSQDVQDRVISDLLDGMNS